MRAWVARATGDDASLFFVVSNERTGQGIGFVQLVRLDFVHGHGQLGIALAPEARGQGHGAAAIRLIEEHARDVFNLRKVVLNVLGSNAHAARLYERVGYTKVGTLRAHFYHREAHHDVVVMEKLLSEHRIDS